MEFIIVFIALSIVNVVFSTIRSITTIKSGKGLASLISGGYFAFYNIMLIYTVAEFPMWQKCIITFVCNVIGVWIVKYLEEKMRKDKLWKVDCTFYTVAKDDVSSALDELKIPFVYNEYGKHIMFTIFCNTQKESTEVAKIVNKYQGKYFVSENCGTLF